MSSVEGGSTEKIPHVRVERADKDSPCTRVRRNVRGR